MEFTTKNKIPEWLRHPIFLTIIFILMFTTGSLLYYQSILSKKYEQQTRNFYSKLVNSSISFTDTGDIIFPDEKKFLSRKQEYIDNNQSFVEANLRTMTLTLYEEGKPVQEIEISSKGKSGSWFETPTGNYSVLGKEINHYSTIGNVWMPYSIQFYGNFFIHGWPNYDNGKPVPKGFSGGCIRLTNNNAKIVYDFVKNKMPILVLEDEDENTFGSLKSKTGDVILPEIKADSFLISNLSNDSIIVKKNENKKTPLNSVTNLMSAVISHELIHLSRQIKVPTKNLMANIIETFQVNKGEYYTGFDLLYPLLMQSSSDAAQTLASYLGQNVFVKNMNAKANSLEMNDTTFLNVDSNKKDNMSTAEDVLKLIRYVYFKRPFILDITNGKKFDSYGLTSVGETINISELKNHNNFTNEKELIGGINDTDINSQNDVTVWNIKSEDGDVPIAIIVLNSKDSYGDTQKLLNWIKSNYEVR